MERTTKAHNVACCDAIWWALLSHPNHSAWTITMGKHAPTPLSHCSFRRGRPPSLSFSSHAPFVLWMNLGASRLTSSPSVQLQQSGMCVEAARCQRAALQGWVVRPCLGRQPCSEGPTLRASDQEGSTGFQRDTSKSQDVEGPRSATGIGHRAAARDWDEEDEEEDWDVIEPDKPEKYNHIVRRQTNGSNGSDGADGIDGGGKVNDRPLSQTYVLHSTALIPGLRCISR